MDIYYPMVLYLLERRCALRLPTDDSLGYDRPLTAPRMYRGELLPGYLYVTDNPELAGRQPDVPVLLAARGLDFDPELLNIAWADEEPQLLLELLTDLFQELQRWDCRMKDLTGPDFSGLFRMARQVLDLPFALQGGNFINLEVSPDYFAKFRYFTKDTRKVADDALVEFFLDPEYMQNLERTEAYIYPSEPCPDKFLCKNLFLDGKKIAGFHVILERDTVLAGELQLFDHIFRYVERMCLETLGREVHDRQNDKIHQMFRQLLFGGDQRMTRKEIMSALDSYGWDSRQSYVIYALKFLDNTRFPLKARHLCRRLEELCSTSVAVSSDAEMAWILNETRSPDEVKAAKSAAAADMRDLMFKIGASSIFIDIYSPEKYYRQAVQALRIGEKTDPQAWHFRFDDYLLPYMLDRVSEEYSPRELAGHRLCRLLEFDLERGTDYTATLRAYLDHLLNAAQAAQACFIHRSTFIRRLERIEEITGLDLKSRDHILQLMISMRLLDDQLRQKTSV